MSKASEAALKAYPVEMTPLNYQDLIDQFGGKTEIDVNTYPRCLFQMGYEQAEKDILSQITKEHIDGLKWIERSNITSQPVPYHKYCKDLHKTLEDLLSDE